jgi:uncharacterized protein YggU (UPF0235/DUF167 family)
VLLVSGGQSRIKKLDILGLNEDQLQARLPPAA